MAVGEKRDRYGITIDQVTWIRDSYALTVLYMFNSVILDDFEFINIDWFVEDSWFGG